MLYDAVVGDRVALEPLTLVMKGEHLPPGTRWRGITAQVVTAVADPATGGTPADVLDPDMAEATRVLPRVDRDATTRVAHVVSAAAPASDPGRTMRMRSVHASGAIRPRRSSVAAAPDGRDRAGPASPCRDRAGPPTSPRTWAGTSTPPPVWCATRDGTSGCAVTPRAGSRAPATARPGSARPAPRPRGATTDPGPADRIPGEGRAAWFARRGPSLPNGNRPLALVYRGPAARPEGCSEAVAALLAPPHRFDVRYVGPREELPLTADTLAGAAVYAQPGGGTLRHGWKRMRDDRHAIRGYVQGGGRYLGFCLGGYLAGATPGFGLLPGDTDRWIDTPGATVRHDGDDLVTLRWAGRDRTLFFQDGPHFVLEAGRPAGVLGRYPNGAVAAVVAPYGAAGSGSSGRIRRPGRTGSTTRACPSRTPATWAVN